MRRAITELSCEEYANVVGGIADEGRASSATATATAAFARFDANHDDLNDAHHQRTAAAADESDDDKFSFILMDRSSQQTQNGEELCINRQRPDGTWLIPRRRKPTICVLHPTTADCSG